MSRSHTASRLALAVLAIVLTTTGFRCTLLNQQEQQLLQPITITWWGTFDDGGSFNQLVNDYRALHPNISVEYRQIRPEEFNQSLLDALAEDRGPDIISLNTADLTSWLAKLEPLPPTTKMAYQVTQKSLGVKEETLVEVRENQSLTAGKVKGQFIDPVYDDVVRAGKIYGLPLSIDTLALLYNRDLFNNANLAVPPKNWLDVQGYVKKLTFQDSQGHLIQGGIALGTATNIDSASDVVALLMMQNGAQMTIGSSVAFSSLPPGGDPNYNPGPEALRFYTDFANPSKEVFTWDKTFPNALDAFAQGKVAMIFAYQNQLPQIEAKRQGKLNYGIAKVPQIEGRPSVNIAQYWIQTVAKKSKHINEAWDFIQFISGSTEAKKYLTTTKRPTALRALVADQIADDQLNVFADQLLTSKNWYRGNNRAAMRNAFSDMIESVGAGTFEPEKAAQIAAQKIQQTY